MEKEKVIELAKRSKNDERVRQVIGRGYHISGITTASAILLIMILRGYKGDLFSQDLLLIIMAQLSALSLYQFIKLKNPVYLITFVIGVAAVILSLINVLTEYGYF